MLNEMAQAEQTELINLQDISDIVKHKDIAPVLQAVSQGCSLQQMTKLIKSLEQRTRGHMFQPIICALTYTIVTLNNRELMSWIMHKYRKKLKNCLSSLLLYAFACQHYEMTDFLLQTGADPLEGVDRQTVFTQAPHLDLNKTMARLEDTTGQQPNHHFRSAWESALIKDDLILFKQIYKYVNISKRKQPTTHLQRKLKEKFGKFHTLVDVSCSGGNTIQEYCLTDNICHLTTNDLKMLKDKLESLFSTSCQQLDKLQELYQHRLLHANTEYMFSFTWDEAHILPANQLHHAVSVGLRSFLTEDYFCTRYSRLYQLRFLNSQSLDIISFLKEHGVKVDGMVMSTGIFDTEYPPYIRPVTLVAVHITSWLLTNTDKKPCSVVDYIAQIHRLLDMLPFSPHDMKPTEVNPLYFTLEHLLDMSAMQRRCLNPLHFPQPRKNPLPHVSSEELITNSKEALMIAEDLCLYYLKQGFRFDSNTNIYVVLQTYLVVNGKYFVFRHETCPVYKNILDMYQTFFIKLAKVCLAYHTSTLHSMYPSLYELLCDSSILLFDDGYQLVKTILHSSNSKDYYQFLRGITQFATDDKKIPQKNILDFCENLLTKPQQLQELCRGTIYSAVKAPVFKYAEELPLPKQLIVYVTELI